VRDRAWTRRLDENTRIVTTRSSAHHDGGGYPDGVSFIANDIRNWESIAWESLALERCPTVIIDEDALEIMLIPIDRPTPLAWLDRVRGRVAVRIGWRQHNGARAYELPVSLSRSRLAALEPAVNRRAG
jgi:hypothetical protein